MIHCIGDSHASFFCGVGDREKNYMQFIYGSGPQKNVSPHFRSYRIGAATAYNLSTKKPAINQIINRNIQATTTDRILFCFGEVDCRMHLSRRIVENKEDMTTVVHECVDRYFEVIMDYAKHFQVAVWGVIGTNPPHLPYEHTRGTMQERNKITHEFNQYLAQLCEKATPSKIPFVSIFPHMVNDKFETDDTYIMDVLHLSQSAMPKTIELFKEQNLI